MSYNTSQYYEVLAMSLRLGDTAPNFEQQSSEGEINFYEFLGDDWAILFSHPADYTPVGLSLIHI